MIGRTLSHFRILDRIGEGGMGVVYRAEDEKLQRVVALKVLPPDRLADQERRLRFLREARAAAAVTHPGIAVVYEIDESDGIVFIAMELVGGKTLRSAIGGKPMPLREALRLGVEIAEALSAAHQARLVHRDLKPDNVMVNPDGRVKILDFGLAKLLEEREEPDPGEESRLATISDEMTKAGRVLGTAAYMSPEQIRGQSVDTRSDLFSFGIVMHEMVAGAPPFRGATSMDVMSAILNKEASPLSQINAEVPSELDRIVGKCLEKDPTERFQDTRDLVVDLRRLKRDTESGAASRPSATGQMEAIGSTRRRPLASTLVWVGLAACLIAAGLGAWRFWPGAPKAEPMTQRLILADEETEGRPTGASLSSDGEYLALASGEGKLFVRELSSGSTRTLSLPEGSDARFTRWSADDRQILVAVRNQTSSSIWVVSALTGAFRRLGQEISAGPWPSPDGGLLAFVPPQSNELWVMGSQGDSPRRLISLAEGTWIVRAAWAPDSRRLAFLSQVRSRQEQELTIEVSDLTGKRTVVVSDPKLRAEYGQVSHLCWLPGGRLLFSLSEPPPNADDMNLWEINVDLDTGRAVGAPSRITREARVSILAAGATSDGKRILAYKSLPRGDAYVGSLSADGMNLGDIRRLTFRGAGDRVECWTRDGRVIVWSERNGTPDLFIQAPGSRESEGLVVGPEVVSGATLSPDGSSVLYRIRESGTGPAEAWTIMRVNLTDRTTWTVGKMRPGSRLECPSLPGAPCVLGEVEGMEIIFSLFDPERGTGREFARVALRSLSPPWNISPDGERLVLMTRDSTVRWVGIVEVPRGQIREVVLDGVERWRGLAFTADGKRLLLSGAFSGKDGLLDADLSGRVTFLYRPEEEGAWADSPLPSPDGRYLAFNVGSLSLDLWLLENL